MTDISYAPRYREIELALRARIARLRAGQRLPSDSQLCAEFGVSRMTARHAMSQLAEEGLVRRDPGRGTFVAEPPTHRRANFLMTFSHEMRRQGRSPSSRIVACVVRPPTDPERKDLRVSRGGEVIDLRRVRLADDEPVAVERAVLASRCIAAVLAADLVRGSLHEALISEGFFRLTGRTPILGRTFLAEEMGSAFQLAISGPAPEAWKTAMQQVWGTDVVEMGVGGSIPFVADFSARFPDAAILLTGPGDPTSAVHAPNESQDLGDLEKHLRAGKSPKYENDAILGKWSFNYAASYNLARRKKVLMSLAELRALKRRLGPLKDAILTSYVDNTAKLVIPGAAEQPATRLNGTWRNEGGGRFQLKVSGAGIPLQSAARVDQDRLYLTLEGISLIFEK